MKYARCSAGNQSSGLGGSKNDCRIRVGAYPVLYHIADQVLVMYLGNTVEHGDKNAIFTRPLHPYTQALLASTPGLAGSGPAAHGACVQRTDAPLGRGPLPRDGSLKPGERSPRWVQKDPLPALVSF